MSCTHSISCCITFVLNPINIACSKGNFKCVYQGSYLICEASKPPTTDLISISLCHSIIDANPFLTCYAGLWTVAFRSMDDIKETVRISGERLCRAVATLTTRICDVSLTDISDAHKELNIVLPLLLTEGILSKVDSVWKASIGVVMKLTMHAGTAIRPHMADLICCMLESLSSLEDQGLNYIELHSKCQNTVR
ncbi:hypothetical protein AHAS_Ahas07G0064400 [Arachis hypogaea]